MTPMTDDPGCPKCEAPGDVFCTSSSGRVVPDHAARVRERERLAQPASPVAAAPDGDDGRCAATTYLNPNFGTLRCEQPAGHGISHSSPSVAPNVRWTP